jgi:endonuclease III
MSSKTTSSDERSDDNKKSTQCISRFFQPEQDHHNTKRGAAKRSRTKEENTIVILDDDLDSEVDDIDDDFDVDVSPVVGTTEKMKLKQQKTENDDIYNDNNNNNGKDYSSVDTNDTNDNGMIMPKAQYEKDNANDSVEDKRNGVIEIGKDDDNNNNDNDDSSIAIPEEQSGKVAALSNSNFKDKRNNNNNAAIGEDPLLVQSCNSIASNNETIIEMVNTTTTTMMNQKEELESELVVSSPSTNNKKGNPFAKFAYGGDGAAVASTAPIIGLKERRFFKSFSDNKRTNINKDNNDNRHPKKKKMSKVSKELLKLKDISSDEQDKIVRKWHSMADSSVSLEDRRYQILLAARLHARCQEPTVRKAMAVLRDLVKPETLSINEIIKLDPEVLANHITNLQYYNVKAAQIVKAANEIKSQHGGLVPEDEFSLLQITGIGKTFADLLAFVNTREAHERYK